MVSGPEDAVGHATPLRGHVVAPRASSTSRVLVCVWIVAKVHLTKILVMTQRLVFVWMVAIFFEVLVMAQKWMVAIFWHANEL